MAPIDFRIEDSDAEKVSKILDAVGVNYQKNKTDISSSLKGDWTFLTDKELGNEFIRYCNQFGGIDKLADYFNYDSKKGIWKGSSSYLNTAWDQFCKSQGLDYRLMTPPELEELKSELKGTYEDSALALRSLEGRNEQKAKYLYNQIKQRNPKFAELNGSKLKVPLFVFLKGLELDENLDFNLTEESQYFQAPILNKGDGHFSDKDLNKKISLPIKLTSDGDRSFYTQSDGLSRFLLGRVSNLSSRYDDLSYSDGVGRVVLKKSRSDAPKN